MRFLVKEKFKRMKGIAPSLGREIFSLYEENGYNLGNRNDFTILNISSVHNGLKCLRLIKCLIKIWEK